MKFTFIRPTSMLLFAVACPLVTPIAQAGVTPQRGVADADAFRIGEIRPGYFGPGIGFRDEDRKKFQILCTRLRAG